MASTKHLIRIASAGFADMMPALRVAFNKRSDDDQLRAVFGERPRLMILLVTIASIASGFIVSALYADLNEFINWSAVLVSMAFALVIRRYLFKTKQAGNDDFPWLAATLIPAAIALVVISAIQNVTDGSVTMIDGAPIWTAVGVLLKWFAMSCGVAAGLCVAVAALCYSRNWLVAAKELALSLFLFTVVIKFLTFMMLEVGIMDHILSAVIFGIFHYRFPSWVGDFADEISYAALLAGFYFAIIGATWTVCRDQFSTLLETGSVNVVASIRALIEAEKEEKKRAKKEKRDAKKAAKLAKKKG